MYSIVSHKIIKKIHLSKCFFINILMNLFYTKKSIRLWMLLSVII